MRPHYFCLEASPGQSNNPLTSTAEGLLPWDKRMLSSREPQLLPFALPFPLHPVSV